MLLHVIVLCQHQTHWLHKLNLLFLKLLYLWDMVFTFCPYSVNVTERSWKCVTLIKKSVCVKILLCANIQVRKAALVRNCFSRHNNFRLLDFPLSLSFSLSLSAIFDQINTDVLFRPGTHILREQHHVNMLVQHNITLITLFAANYDSMEIWPAGWWRRIAVKMKHKKHVISYFTIFRILTENWKL